MIQTRDVNVNPFLRNEATPSYFDNIGETYPAILIKDTYKSVRVYDGLLYVGSEFIDGAGMFIGDVVLWLISNGIDTYAFPGFEHLPALSIANYSNTDISYLVLDKSPMDISSCVSEYIAPNIPGSYLDMVDVIIKDGSYKAINGKLISDSSSFGKKIPVTHKAKTFILMAADNNIIRDVRRVSHIPAIHNTIVDFNLKTYGRDNENLDI